MATVVQLDDIIDEVYGVAHSQVWAAVGTVDAKNRPHVRILHPIWEKVDGKLIGWVGTGRHSGKEKHLARVPYASLCYNKDMVKPISIDCHAAFDDDLAARQRLWELFRSTPEPLGYDTSLMWKSFDDPEFGALKFTPYRITLGHLGVEWRVWKADES